MPGRLTACRFEQGRHHRFSFNCNAEHARFRGRFGADIEPLWISDDKGNDFFKELNICRSYRQFSAVF
jgi:hypothetical protein